MNSVHDLGGMQGFGPVVAEPHEPPFHEPWEGRVLALSRAVLYTRAWNIDQFRHSQERLPGRTYLTVSYYHRWLLGLTQSAKEHGWVTDAELAAGHSAGPGPAVERTMPPEVPARGIVRGAFERTPPRPARFAPGDRVRTRNMHPLGHTRLPRYARDKVGRVDLVIGCHVFPDSAGNGGGEDPQWLYAVVFEARTLWGEGADPTLSVSIDAFEPYLEPA